MNSADKVRCLEAKLGQVLKRIILGTIPLLITTFSHAQEVKLKDGASFCRDFKGAECISDGSRFNGKLNGVSFITIESGGAWVQSEPGMRSDAGEYNEGWNISCQKDAISGTISCYIRKWWGDPTISFASPKATPKVSIFSEHEEYPGTKTSIRVGKQIFHTEADYYFPNSPLIASLMKDGVEVVTQYRSWPHKTTETKVTPEIYGLQVAIQIAKWNLKNLR